MRKTILFFLFTSIICLGVFAQTYRIDTSEISFENKLRACFSVIFEAPSKTTKYAWSDYLKKNYNIKVKGIGLFSSKDIIVAEDVTINTISDKRSNMYARVTDLGTGSEMKFFMSFGYDYFIGPLEYPGEFAGMKKLLNDFSVNFLNKYYADEAADLTKKVKSLEKEIKSINKTIANNRKKASKESEAIALGLEAKNNSLLMEAGQKESEIKSIAVRLSQIKLKQEGITRN